MGTQVINKYLPTTAPSGAPAPLAVYWFNSAANRTVDQTGNGKTLTSAGTWSFVDDLAITGLTGAYINGGGTQYLTRSDEDFRLARTTAGAGNGYYTLEAVMNQTLGNDGSILDIGSSGESGATNVLYRMGAGSSSSWGWYTFFAEYGAGGTDISYNHAGADKVYNRVIHLCLTCDDAGNERKLYVDGVLKTTVSVYNRAEKAASGNTQVFNIGRNFDGGQRFRGYLYSVRITAGTYSDADVASAYQSIIGDPVRVVGGQSSTSPYVGDRSTEQLTQHNSSYQETEAWEDTLSYETDTQQNPGSLDGDDSNQQSMQAWEDLLYYVLNRYEKFTTATDTASTDAYGTRHFLAGQWAVWDGFIYDSRNDPWANPTLNNFTGYAKDGYRYTSGVQDAGPVLAPWASEAASSIRGPRQSFPDRVLVLSSQGSLCELVIFDLDSYNGTVASLHVWMRFVAHASRSMLGRYGADYRHSCMKNGMLSIALLETGGGDRGGIVTLDFKLDGSQDAGHYLRSDLHYKLVVGKNFTNRNETGVWTTTGVSPNVLIESESYYRVCMVTSSTNDCYIIGQGEDKEDPITIYIQNGVPQTTTRAYGSNVGSDNLNDYWYRNCFVDENDILWFSHGAYLYCGVDYYKDASLLAELPASGYSSGWKMMPYSDIGESIYWITGTKGYLYLSTLSGIYRVDKNTLQSYLCYTAKGGNGGGRLNQPPAGEIIPGARKWAYKIDAVTLDESSHLTVSTFRFWPDANDISLQGGAVCVIRLYDDYVLFSAQYGEGDDDLREDGAYLSLPLVR